MRTNKIEKYISHVSNSTKFPIYKIELLRRDETPYAELSGEVVTDSGSLNSTNESGVRRTCSFTLANIGENFTEYIENLTIGDKFRLWLGENIENEDILFEQGIFLFDNPVCASGQGDNSIKISGTDKWNGLNGVCGGVLEGTYVIKKGSLFGDMVRRTLNLDIVNDPINPNIHPSLEKVEITYDITKTQGETVADLFLDVALNINTYIYYDKFGRLTAIPMEEDVFKPTAYCFKDGDVNYISSSKTIGLDNIYNSVLVVSENTSNTEPDIVCELKNEDLSDPNSIPNCGVKKVYVVSDYLSGITTQELCNARAVYELRKIRKKYAAISISCAPIFFLDADDVIEIDSRYVINSISFNIGSDIQTSMNVSSLKSL